MSEHPPSKQRASLTWICSLSSILLLLTFITVAFHIRLGLGHWPTPMTEDYRTTAFRIHEHALIAVVLFTVYAAGPLWLLFLCFRGLRLSRRTHATQAVVYGLGWLLIVLAGKYDPTTFTQWFLD